MPVIALTAAVALGGCRCAREAEEPSFPHVVQTSEPIRPIADDRPVPAVARGMWVWSTRNRLDAADGIATLLASCRRAHANEVYLSVNGGVLEHPAMPQLLAELRAAGIRVEALAGDALWYVAAHRRPMIDAIEAVATFNSRHPKAFAAIHLDIEPHQLPENRGNHGFLPALAETLATARDRAAKLGLATSADLPRFAFDEAGAAFARAVDRPFVMLYQLRDKSPDWLVDASRSVLDRAYAGVDAGWRGRLVVGLRIEDYGTGIPTMVQALDDGDVRTHTMRYGGWAIHDEAKYRALWTGR